MDQITFAKRSRDLYWSEADEAETLHSDLEAWDETAQQLFDDPEDLSAETESWD